MKREVAAELEVEITAPTTLEFQIAVAPHPNAEVSEQLSLVLDGNMLHPLEISGAHGNRNHKSLWVGTRLSYVPGSRDLDRRSGGDFAFRCRGMP
jgi:hypothetical protein